MWSNCGLYNIYIGIGDITFFFRQEHDLWAFLEMGHTTNTERRFHGNESMNQRILGVAISDRNHASEVLRS